jgi:hypothetical protein
VGVTGTAINQGPSFTAGTYNIRVSEGIPVGTSVFASPVRYKPSIKLAVLKNVICVLIKMDTAYILEGYWKANMF